MDVSKFALFSRLNNKLNKVTHNKLLRYKQIKNIVNYDTETVKNGSNKTTPKRRQKYNKRRLV